MTIAHRLSISTAVFLIGLGTSPVLAQNVAANDDMLDSAAIDQTVDRDVGHHADLMDGRRADLFGEGSSSVDLTTQGQALETADQNLAQARRTERQDLELSRIDSAEGNTVGAQDELAAAQNERNTIQTDRQAVANDRVASWAAVQPDVQTVQQDRLTLNDDLQQTRTDWQDGNTGALGQDRTNDRTARQNLQTAETALQQDRADNGLGNFRGNNDSFGSAGYHGTADYHDAYGNNDNRGHNNYNRSDDAQGYGYNRNGNGDGDYDNRDKDRFASNQPAFNQPGEFNAEDGAAVTEQASANTGAATTTNVTAGQSTPIGTANNTVVPGTAETGTTTIAATTPVSAPTRTPVTTTPPPHITAPAIMHAGHR
jgi:hypothetical protein